jgi:hypothetical protein
MVEEFINQEEEYLDWLNMHPTGFVLNTFKYPKPSYLVLHRASCRSVGVKPKAYVDGGFTARQFKKVVALEEYELLQWIKTYSSNFSHVCSKCFKLQ